MARIAPKLRKAYTMCAQALVAERVSLDAAEELGLNVDFPIFSVGQAGELADIHPQTLRQYDRLGLIVPQRTPGGARRYSLRDIDRLSQAQRMSQEESINLAGITRILQLMEENRQLKRQNRQLRRRMEGNVVFEAGADGEVIEVQRVRRVREPSPYRRTILQITAR
ncbi:helix-turn-helix transcriptional regulator [Bifidobacterium sp. 82T24]|uniref:Heat-shock protein HspR n=2 Tax=Bifidobacterium TaxID=1678 RepID=A0A2M9H6P9_9BIFI|nr:MULTISPECIES: helix-turn-helix transcriptional regulator [Bifidobacterium]MBW3088352.1 helix-turn-helix transcriptional regulator [Bifidobacterium pluvialisilvae]NEG97020.1 MerR family transcriptional regulator [Bifidobacterium sp. SMB2]NEH11997.1 MerR family transcriptional regulator [Bifidobacterium saimiriisciurei]PJM72465.1 heat-shock protein HspR [Bifidobacterium primatium]